MPEHRRYLAVRELIQQCGVNHDQRLLHARGDRVHEGGLPQEKAGEQWVIEPLPDLLQQRHHELSQVRSERGGIVEQAKSLGEQERGRIVERARREAEMLMQQTEERLGEEVRRARVALREEVAELAVRVAAQVLKREISRQDHDRLIEDVVARMTLTQEPPAAGGSE